MTNDTIVTFDQITSEAKAYAGANMARKALSVSLSAMLRAYFNQVPTAEAVAADFGKLVNTVFRVDLCPKGGELVKAYNSFKTLVAQNSACEPAEGAEYGGKFTVRFESPKDGVRGVTVAYQTPEMVQLEVETAARTAAIEAEAAEKQAELQQAAEAAAFAARPVAELVAELVAHIVDKYGERAAEVQAALVESLTTANAA